MADAATLLAEVEAAIQEIQQAGAVVSYAIRGRSVRKTDLVDLYKLRDKLRREVTTGGGLPVGYGVKDRSLAES